MYLASSPLPSSFLFCSLSLPPIHFNIACGWHLHLGGTRISPQLDITVGLPWDGQRGLPYVCPFSVYKQARPNGLVEYLNTYSYLLAPGIEPTTLCGYDTLTDCAKPLLPFQVLITHEQLTTMFLQNQWVPTFTLSTSTISACYFLVMVGFGYYSRFCSHCRVMSLNGITHWSQREVLSTSASYIRSEARTLNLHICTSLIHCFKQLRHQIHRFHSVVEAIVSF